MSDLIANVAILLCFGITAFLIFEVQWQVGRCEEKLDRLLKERWKDGKQ